MDLDALFKLFGQQTPVCVMVQMLMRSLLAPGELDDRLNAAGGSRTYIRQLLPSTLVEVMSLVVTGKQRSLHAAHKAANVAASVQALYSKLARLDPEVGRELVRTVAEKSLAILEHLHRWPPLLAGYRTFIIDGNHLGGTEHRIKETRTRRGAPLPGRSLVVYDADHRLVVDVFPVQDAYTSERTLFPRLCIQPGALYLADRDFSTNPCVRNLIVGGACFLIRKHSNNLKLKEDAPGQVVGTEQGRKVSEQAVLLDDEQAGAAGLARRLRLITIHREKDAVVLVTNLPASVDAVTIAQLYRERWKIELAFGELTRFIGCEVKTLGYPQAALFAFCVALTGYNLWTLVRGAIAREHGQETERATSLHYLADELSGTYRGMMVALPEEWWMKYEVCALTELAAGLCELARAMPVERYRKSVRGPKKPVKRTGKPDSHFSTQRLLDKRGRG